jgi:hypothetical protein
VPRLTALELTAVLAVAAIGTLLSRVYYDKKDAWWKRAQWAIDKATGPDVSDAERKIGLDTMGVLIDERFTPRADIRILADAIDLVAEQAERREASAAASRGSPDVPEGVDDRAPSAETGDLDDGGAHDG